jgi:hypothetical protein
MSNSIRISLNHQPVPIAHGEGKKLVIEQNLSKDESKTILKDIARSLVDTNNKVSNSELKIQIKDNGAWLRASNLGHGSNAARSIFQALIKKSYGDTGERLFEQHLQETQGKTLEADSFVKLYIALADSEGDLPENDSLRQARLDRAKFVLPEKLDIDPHQPTPVGKKIDGGKLNLAKLPPDIKRELDAKLGRATPEFIAWGIQSGQIDLGIADIARHQIDVKELERTGASTLSLFKVSKDGKPQFVVKEPGTFYEFDEAEFYAGYRQNAERVWTDPMTFEDKRLSTIEASQLGQLGSVEGPENSQFGLAHTVSTCRYETGQMVKVSQTGDPAQIVNARVEHQLTVVRHAAGEPASGVFSSPTISIEMKAQAAKLLGQGLGAFHKQTVKADPAEASGLRVLVHGDYHPGNLFMDRDNRTVTAIDLAGSIGNFETLVFDSQFRPTTVKKDLPGWDPLRELKRAISTGELHAAGQQPDSKVIESFLEGYAENFTDYQDANGQPRFTAESLRKMINNYRGDAAALT